MYSQQNIDQKHTLDDYSLKHDNMQLNLSSKFPFAATNEQSRNDHFSRAPEELNYTRIIRQLFNLLNNCLAIFDITTQFILWSIYRTKWINGCQISDLSPSILQVKIRFFVYLNGYVLNILFVLNTYFMTSVIREPCFGHMGYTVQIM